MVTQRAKADLVEIVTGKPISGMVSIFRNFQAFPNPSHLIPRHMSTMSVKGCAYCGRFNQMKGLSGPLERIKNTRLNNETN